MRRLKHTATRAARGEEGMTLVEMLVGVTAAMVVIFAAYGAVNAASLMQTRTVGRIDSAERGRSAMETITRDIRAQQCVATKTGTNSAPTPAMILAGNDVIQFYSSVRPAATAPSQEPLPEMRRIEWIQTAATANSADAQAQPIGRIVETIWRPTNSSPPYNFPSTPYRTSTIATDVERARDAGGTVVPFFRYYGYTVTNGVGRPSTTPYAVSGTPLQVGAANLPKIVLVEIAFAARPLAQKVTDAGVTNRRNNVVPFFNRVSVRTADPTDPGVSPLCM